MNVTSVAIFHEYLKQTDGDKAAAAALTIADAIERGIEAITHSKAVDTAPAPPPSAVITVRDAANRLGVSLRTIYDLAQSGRLPCQRIGTGRGTIRIRLADLDAYTTASAGRLIRRGDASDSGVLPGGDHRRDEPSRLSRRGEPPDSGVSKLIRR